MKRIRVPDGMLIAGVSGCGFLNSPAHNRAKYVREHKCHVESEQPAGDSYDRFAGDVVHWPGAKYYSCPTLSPGETIQIVNGEEQP